MDTVLPNLVQFYFTGAYAMTATKTLTIAALSASCGVPASLIRAVAHQFGGWANLKESAIDIASYGADTGWTGFTYTADCVEFYRKHRAEIDAMFIRFCDDVGEEPLTMLASFGCLKHYGLSALEVADGWRTDTAEWSDTIQNALAWYTLEEIARYIVDYAE